MSSDDSIVQQIRYVQARKHALPGNTLQLMCNMLPFSNPENKSELGDLSHALRDGPYMQRYTIR